MRKSNAFDLLFKTKVVDRNKLCELGYNGMPEKHRPMAWRMLLNTSLLRKSANLIEIKNEEYRRKLLKLHKIGDENFLATQNVNLEIPEVHRHQIELDLNRISKKHLFYNEIDISYFYRNILSCFTYQRPVIGYVQGMSDILVPFVTLFADENLETAESSAYFAFLKFIQLIQNNFIENQPGITKNINFFNLKLKEVDEKLADDLKNKGLKPHMFIFRWFNCFFTREFDLVYVFKIYDSAISFSDLNRFLVLFAVSLIVFHKEKIMKMNFEQSLIFLQNLNEYKMEENDMQEIFKFIKFIDK